MCTQSPHLVPSGIGSLGAIVAAIALFFADKWVARVQQREREKRNEDVLLAAIYDDLCLCKLGFIDVVFENLEKLEGRKGFFVQMDVSDVGSLTQTVVERAGVIQNAELRRNIVHAYSGIASLRVLIRANSKMVRRLNSLIEKSAVSGVEPPSEAFMRNRNLMVNSIENNGGELRQRVEDVGFVVQELIVKLRDYR